MAIIQNGGRELSDKHIAEGFDSLAQKRRYASIYGVVGVLTITGLTIAGYNWWVAFFATPSFINDVLMGGAALLAMISVVLVRAANKVAPGRLANRFQEAVEGSKDSSGISKVLDAVDLTGMLLICGDPIENVQKARLKARPE